MCVARAEDQCSMNKESSLSISQMMSTGNNKDKTSIINNNFTSGRIRLETKAIQENKPCPKKMI